MTENLIRKFVNNSCTHSELSEIIRWVNNEAFTEEGRYCILKDWKSFQISNELTDDEKFSLIFDKIQSKINIIRNKQESRANNKALFITWITRAAAILLLPVLTYLIFTISERKTGSTEYANLAVDSLEIIAPIGSRTVVQLSDGSKVHLNYGSRIKYPQIFYGEKRELLLTGEAYFEVVHDPKKPFIVNTGKLNIKALGTAFNVNAYPDNDKIETTLVEGKLVLEHYDLSSNIKKVATIEPGQHVSYDLITVTFSGKSENIAKYIAWKDGKLVFDEAPINQVTERLSRMFNVNIEVADDIKDYTYTVIFVDEPLFQILDLMTIATPVRYRSIPRVKLPDGRYSKQTIILEKR